LLNIIEKLSKSTAAALRPADFAYLKDVGVFPNNRLMVARRFLAPIQDDILRVEAPPRSILISWKPEGEDFLDFTFGEEWQDADADFTNILNKLGEDFMGKEAGKKVGAALNVLPLPGFTETLQRRVLGKDGLGIFSGDGTEDLPSGNPNLIKTAKRRKTSGYGEPFAGLKCSISIKMVCEYEQKFISGIDPTIAWMDIIQNILGFGTNDSTTYGLAPGAANKMISWASNPSAMISAMIGSLKNALIQFKDDVNVALTEFKNPTESTKNPTEKQKLNSASELVNKFIDGLIKEGSNVLDKTVRKYLEEIKGITRALSGLPSTPWHVTVGNPLRPIFCSGDMLTEEVKLTLGPTLAFNDLPSSIKAEFTLVNARPLGLQEIMAKFNTGNIRVVNVRMDSTQMVVPLTTDTYMPVTSTASSDLLVGSQSSSSPRTNLTGVTQSSTKENSINPSINSDTNSQNVILK
jgi:hypothetical protein